MTRQLPSLTAVRAFEAAARHCSFTKAAAELNVTPGAVSHQVKALEAHLGLKLFHRRHQALLLTEAGQSCLPFVREALDGLAAGFAQMRSRDVAGVLTVSVSPNFAAKWLVRRLGGFTERHPEIDLRLSASLQHVDFAREDIDLAVRHGDGRWPDLHVTRLATEELFPVCSPRLLEPRDGPSDPGVLRNHTLLHLNDRDDWSKWLDAAGARGVDTSKGAVFNQASLAIDAAVDGQGVALARTCLAAADLLAGRLVSPFAVRLRVPYAYYIVCPGPLATRHKVVVFRDWLLEEAERDRQRLSVAARRGTAPPKE